MSSTDLKICTKCELGKPVTEYHKDRNKPSGLCIWCKTCASNYQRATYAANPEKKLTKSRAYQKLNPDKSRANKLLKKYGLTIEDYDRMVLEQGNACQICSVKTPGGRYNRWAIDHSHRSGVVRGLLCNRCNIAIGLFEDDPILLSIASEYLWGRA